MNRLVKDKPVTAERTPLFAGTITAEIAAEFVQFTKVYDSMVSINEVVADPQGTTVPTDVSLKWATTVHLLDKINETNAAKVAEYINRFSIDFRILFFRSAIIRHPGLRTSQPVITGLAEISRSIHAR